MESLLEAFSLIPDPNALLILCGVGDAESTIQRYSDIDHRIRFLGQIPRDEVMELQSRATVLVNPRTNNSEYTKYSFPSKLMEYLSAGVPVVAHELPGVPVEYANYIFYTKEQTPAGLADKLIEVCSMDPAIRRRRAEAARTWVQTQKDPYTQTERILKLMASVPLPEGLEE
ncbi:glycosyltransferase [Flaviflexus ciconiae]|uniref:Glycosyltransferase n=1 Tax=Flaviflexus ciconiae TaxID=2496867 RepID=A0A3S9PWL6_9ACTO|nr:glycosyltransferase [Flaviflexus ciconiae]AZQ76773.1 glycosyltransferase [Flaviflexus ciconiae]